MTVEDDCQLWSQAEAFSFSKVRLLSFKGYLYDGLSNLSVQKKNRLRDRFRSSKYRQAAGQAHFYVRVLDRI